MNREEIWWNCIFDSMRVQITPYSHSSSTRAHRTSKTNTACHLTIWKITMDRKARTFKYRVMHRTWSLSNRLNQKRENVLWCLFDGVIVHSNSKYKRMSAFENATSLILAFFNWLRKFQAFYGVIKHFIKKNEAKKKALGLSSVFVAPACWFSISISD